MRRRLAVSLAIAITAVLAACGGDKSTGPSQVPASVAGNWLLVSGTDSLSADLAQTDTVVTGTGFVESSQLALVTGGATHVPLDYAGWYTTKGKLHLDATSPSLPQMAGTVDAQALSANKVQGTLTVKYAGVTIFTRDTVLTREP